MFVCFSILLLFALVHFEIFSLSLECKVNLSTLLLNNDKDLKLHQSPLRRNYFYLIFWNSPNCHHDYWYI